MNIYIIWFGDPVVWYYTKRQLCKWNALFFKRGNLAAGSSPLASTKPELSCQMILPFALRYIASRPWRKAVSNIITLKWYYNIDQVRSLSFDCLLLTALVLFCRSLEIFPQLRIFIILPNIKSMIFCLRIMKYPLGI